LAAAVFELFTCFVHFPSSNQMLVALRSFPSAHCSNCGASRKSPKGPLVSPSARVAPGEFARERFLRRAKKTRRRGARCGRGTRTGEIRAYECRGTLPGRGRGESGVRQCSAFDRRVTLGETVAGRSKSMRAEMGALTLARAGNVPLPQAR